MSFPHLARRQTLALLLLTVAGCWLTNLPHSAVAKAQTDLSKRPLEHSDYDVWNTLKQSQISRDGQWVMYGTQRGAVDGERTLTIRNTSTHKQFRISRGTGGQFTYDSRFALYFLASDKEEDKNDRDGRELQILELATGSLITVERVKSMSLPSKSGLWAAWLLESPDRDDQLTDKKSDTHETYEVTSSGLRRPEKKLKLKKRELVQPASKPESPSQSNSNPSPETTTETETETEESSTKEEESSKSKNENDSKDQDKKKKKKAGTQLVLHNLQQGTQWTFPGVVSYEFSKYGDAFAFVTSVASDEPTQEDGDDDPTDEPETKTSQDADAAPIDTTRVGDGVTIVDLKTLQTTQVASGTGHYRSLAFNEAGTQLAFITDHDDYESTTPTWSLYQWNSQHEKSTLIASEGTKGLPENWWVAPKSTLRFSEDGHRLYFETAPIPSEVVEERAKEQADDSESDDDDDGDEDDKPKLDVWHWQDPQLQPEQLLKAKAERKRDYDAVFSIHTGKVAQLANKQAPNVRIDVRSPSNLAVANTNVRYRKMLSWESPGFRDVLLVNLDTGAHQPVLERVKHSASLSPAGKFITWFDAEQKKWFSIPTGNPSSDPIELSAGIEFPLQNETHDTPNLASAYGAAGWLTNDQAFLVYDRYDIWKLDPTGQTGPQNLTGGWGRENNTRLRYVRLDREERALDPEQPMVLRAFNRLTKASGYFRLEPERQKGEAVDDHEIEAPLHQLIMLDEDVSNLRKAELTNDLVFERSSFRTCKDLWSTTMDFEKIHRLSDINPQQDEYSWGTAELVHWKATDGQALDGILYKPADFDPTKQYPMVVNFYERNSDRLHRYYTPAPGRSSICHSFYVSRGYLVFVPDIPYKTGAPGPSAANAILPGVQSLIDQGFVDAKRIGTQGHSWGGYQVAYLITQTDMFACAESGAPVSNMTSAYGGIRWSTGLSRMFQYERTQSRIGEDLWSAREKYIANSPLFFANKINTPVLILHNDQDGAVPWYQGIELFVALRRLEKPAWMLNYNDNPHWVQGNANRRDFAIRMQQFFDHYLKDAPEPQWMAVGIPAVDKGKELGLELLEPKKETPEAEIPGE